MDNIKWLGHIPDNWNILNFNNIFESRYTKVSDSKYQPLSVGKMGVVPQLENVAKTNNNQNRKLIKKGDFVINSRSDRFGACGVSKTDGSCSLIYLVLKLKSGSKFNIDFLEYLFKTQQFAEEFYRNGHGIVDDLWTTTWEDLKKIKVCVPNLSEQNKIVAYLNKRTCCINLLKSTNLLEIEKLKKLKQALITKAVTKGLDPKAEMKDSGVEWIGNIPSTWNISKIKYVAQLNPSVETAKLRPSSQVTFTPMEFIKSGYFIKNYCEYSKICNGSYTLYSEGDIAIAKVTPCFENGNIAIMNDLESKIGLGSSELFILRAINILKKYLFYFLQSDSFKKQGILSFSGASGLKRISSYFLNNCPIPIPTLDEQVSISNYLDKKIEKIEILLSQKHALIEKLEEYKKSLIYEYVTGKKTVGED